MNINEYVYVKLTPQGYDANYHSDFPYPVTEIGDGWSEWQLWALMNVFGPYLWNGCPFVCFENNEIFFEKPTL